MEREATGVDDRYLTTFNYWKYPLCNSQINTKFWADIVLKLESFCIFIKQESSANFES